MKCNLKKLLLLITKMKLLIVFLLISFRDTCNTMDICIYTDYASSLACCVSNL